jgi:prefoldin subunit 5
MGPYGAPNSPQEEIRFLKNQEEMLRKEIDAIDARIKELEKEKSQGGEG